MNRSDCPPGNPETCRGHVSPVHYRRTASWRSFDTGLRVRSVPTQDERFEPLACAASLCCGASMPPQDCTEMMFFAGGGDDEFDGLVGLGAADGVRKLEHH